jgi:hypothetical protein
MTTAGKLTIAQADSILKVLYPSRRVQFLGYKKNPLLALMPKATDFTGKSRAIPIWYGGNQGASRTFATAQANKTGGLFEDFTVTRRKDYALTSIETEAIYASSDNAGSFLNLARTELDNTVRTASDNLAQSMYGNFGGARGQVSAISGTALTLSNPHDVFKFSKGMKLVQSTTDGTSGSLGAAAVKTITAIDRRAGKLYAANWTGFSVDDYLFREGDFGLAIDGLMSWIPETTPVSGYCLNGVDRCFDTRLYGQWHDGTAQSKLEALEDLDTKISYEGGSPDVCLVNPFDFNAIRKELGSEAIWDRAFSPDMGVVSFNALSLNSVSGERLKIVADRNCPYGVFAMLQMDTWELASLGEMPRVLQAMGNQFIWDHDGDSVEIRVGGYGNMGCHAPGLNGMGRFHS